MHMTEKYDMPQSARMRAQIQANTGNFARQRFGLDGVDLTKFDGGGAREPQDHPWTALLLRSMLLLLLLPASTSRARSRPSLGSLVAVLVVRYSHAIRLYSCT